MADPYADEEERQKKATENPLATYFGGQQKTAAAKPPAAPPPPAQATNVGQATAPAQGTPVAPQALQAPQRQQPTNFTNFGRVMAANQDVATRSAQQYRTQAEAQQARAAAALQQSQDRFSGDVAAGSVSKFGPSAPPPGGAPRDGEGLIGDPTQSVPGGGMSAADMLAKSNGTYTGPGGLGDTAGIKDTYAATLAAQNNLNALGTEGGIQALVQQQNAAGNAGTSKLSGSLIGSAGRQDFDALRARFHPEDSIKDAETAAAKQAADAKADSTKNAAEWAKQAGIKGTKEQQEAAYAQAKAKADADKLDAASKAADARVPPKGYESSYATGVGGTGDTEANRQAYMMSGVDQKNPAAVAARQKQIDEYKKAMHLTDQQQLDRGFNDFNSVMSPSVIVQNLAGSKDQTAKMAQGMYNKNGTASQTGSTDNNAIPWDRTGVDGFFVWKNMTPADWDTLNSKPANGPSGQLAWIQTKAQQLRDSQSQSDSAPKTGQTRQ